MVCVLNPWNGYLQKLSMTHIFPKISNRQFATWGPCIRTPKRALLECSHLNRLTSLIGQFCTYLSWCTKLKLVPLTCLLDNESVRELTCTQFLFPMPCLMLAAKTCHFSSILWFLLLQESMPGSFLSRNWIMLTLNPSSHNPKVLV